MVLKEENSLETALSFQNISIFPFLTRFPGLKKVQSALFYVFVVLMFCGVRIEPAEEVRMYVLFPGLARVDIRNSLN